ncbi:hypothetical protein [Streptodolium elevatio]|uniref:Lipoprotein n=1 Tax=Streptodolium elevatio TaxID=3157996 RepID=A0ABV3DJD5_9ACTN
MYRKPPRVGGAAARAAAPALVAAALLAGGCTADGGNMGVDPIAASPGPSVPPQIVGRELPVAVHDRPDLMDYPEMDESVPDAPYGASVLDQVTTELRRETLLMAKVYGEVTARCQGNRVVVAPDAVTSCTTTYQGVEIPWTVAMDDDVVPDSLVINFYTVQPLAELLTPQRVQDAFYMFHSHMSDQFRCDTMPAAFRVERGTAAAHTDTGYRCQYLGLAEGGVRTWVDVPIKVTRDGGIAY